VVRVNTVDADFNTALLFQLSNTLWLHMCCIRLVHMLSSLLADLTKLKIK